jgi:hypothetical protein
LLVILGLAVFWYLLVPIGGAFVIRRSWRLFRHRFEELRRAPGLGYENSRQAANRGRRFRFLGDFESVTDAHTLWVRNADLTIPVQLAGARIYVLPSAEGYQEDDGFAMDGLAPVRVRWDTLATISEGVRVYVGGRLGEAAGHPVFVSDPGEPLLIILFDGPDRSLLVRTVQAGRQRNEYWNPATPYALALGIFSQLIMAVTYLGRPAFRLTVVVALIAVFGPLFPLMPPGVLLTALYRRLWRRARRCRSYRDLVRLPVSSVAASNEDEGYGYKEVPMAEALAADPRPPLLPPDGCRRNRGVWRWYGTPGAGSAYPKEPQDPMAAWALVPGDPVELARSFSVAARWFEAGAMALLLAGIAVNCAFALAAIRLWLVV